MNAYNLILPKGGGGCQPWGGSPARGVWRQIDLPEYEYPWEDLPPSKDWLLTSPSNPDRVKVAALTRM